MKEIMKEDMIRQIDFDSAFPETPSVVHEAVMNARASIIRYERRRRYFRTAATAAAACLLVVAGAAVFFSRAGGGNSDLITPPVLTDNEIVIDMETPVFSSKADPFYHRKEDCTSGYEDSVELPLITAVEFEKAACPVCAKELSGADKISREEAEKKAAPKENASLQPVISTSDGAAERYLSLVKAETKPDYEAEFFDGRLKVFDLMNGTYLAATDPTPDDGVFNYVLIGRQEIDAKRYYELNGGPGRYASYNEAGGYLTASWGDDYYTHTYYETAIRTDVVDETGLCAWLMTEDVYKAFLKDESFAMNDTSDGIPGFSAMLWIND